LKTWKQAPDYILPSDNMPVLNGYTLLEASLIQSEPQCTPTSAPLQAEQIRTNLSQIARRQWSLWSSAVMVTLLLALGIASFAFPGLLAQAAESSSFFLTSATRGLVGLVLVFNVYTVYQQLQIHRIQRQLSDQVEALGKVEVRTEEVYKLAVLDPLTGLHNRRSGEQRLVQEISRSQRHGCPLTILTLDLNGLKHVNDEFGHAAGDELIKCFAERLNKAIRGSDLAVRLGGDEFLVVLPECKPEEVRHVLSRLSGLKVECNGRLVEISFSAGWTNFKPGESPEELLKRADDSLYVNKRASREQRLQIVASK
jgi:diguanylate cyclase (GGDEF)-like protein